MIFKKNFTAILICASIFLGLHGSAFAQIQKGLDIDGVSVGELSGYSVSMPDSVTIAFGAPENDINGTNSGQARVYQWNGISWILKGMEINGEAAGDKLGQSVSMPDANTIAIAAPYNVGNGTNAGHVRIYAWNGSNWMQKGMDLDGEATYNNSGSSVSMPDSNTVAIGSPFFGFNGYWDGRVRIYSWNGSAWVQKGNDINGLLNSNEGSGTSVSMPNSNTVAIGAPNNESNGSWTGSVGIFLWNGNAWVQKGNDFYGQTLGSTAGTSVSMPDSNTVAIGAPGFDTLGIDAGHVDVYSWNGSDWVQKGTVIYGETAGDNSGYSVSMPDASTVAIGALFNNGNGTLAGHVRIYNWTGSIWMQNGNDMNGEAAYDQSGCFVSMPDANTVGIGAYLNDGNGDSTGHVRIYSICSTTNSITASDCNSYTSPSGNYTWTSSGMYTDIIPNAAGCDSVITVNLTIGNNSNINLTACSSYTSPSGNYTWTSSGTFMDTIPDVAGCDSVITINLTIGNNTSNINSIACSSYNSPSGNYTWTISGIYMDTIPNTAGCDSVITVNLTISNTYSSINPIVCSSYISPSGNYIWTSSGTYLDTIPNFTGCDSVITVNLSINNVNTSVSNLSPNLISNAFGASYQWLDCNDAMAIINGEINQNFTATSNGNYAVQVNQYGCMDTSICEIVNNVGIMNLNLEYGFEVYPNPSKGSFTVFIKNGISGTVKIVDVLGRTHQTLDVNKQTINYAVKNLPRGLYFVEFVMSNGRIEVKRIEVL